MKRLLTIIILSALTLGLAACAPSASAPSPSASPSKTAEPSASPSPSAKPSPTASPSEEGVRIEIEPSPVESGVVTEIEEGTYQSGGEWPDNEYTALIPKPKSGTLLNVTVTDNGASINMGMTKDEALAYISQLKKAGYTKASTEEENSEMGMYTFSGSKDSHKVSLVWYTDVAAITIV